MKITVEYWNQVKSATGIGGEIIEIDDQCSVSDLLRSVAERYGEPLFSLLMDDDRVMRPSTIVSINGEMAPCRMPRILHEGDVVAVLLPVAGG